MTEITLRGFAPEHRELALSAVARYEEEFPQAPPGTPGACAYTYQHGGRTVRLYLYRTKAGAVVVSCMAVTKAKERA
jgi:hypothetical protein